MNDSLLLPLEETKKKKKKRKPKKASDKSNSTQGAERVVSAKPPPVLCISRNKHWKYISSYHVRFIFFMMNLKANRVTGTLVATSV